MGIENVISVLGAIAMFLFGMSTMTEGLERLSSGRLERILEKLTSNIVKGVLLGALVTGVIQSSAATTVMCVGFVNSGIMKLRQAVGIIMGANIGTTVTGQILRLGDISEDNIFLMLIKPEMLGPILAAVGILFYMFIKSGKKQNVGQIVLGLGILFIGMKTLENAVAPLQEVPEFQALFTSFSNPFLGVLAGAVVTALIQSSSASVGILQALTTTGVISFNVAVPIIFGQNIGTCVTALLSSIGASRNAKRTAMIHLFFNVIGTVVFLVLIYGGNMLFHFPFWEATMDRGSIANFHTCFNVACTVLLLPFHNALVRLVELVVPDDGAKEEFTVLDQRFLSTPAVAIDRARSTVIQMGESSIRNYGRSQELLHHFDAKKLERLNETENAIDKAEDLLDGYLVKLTDRALTPEENMTVSELLHTLSDFERIGDYAVNLSECAVTMKERNLSFSEKAMRELEALSGAVEEILNITLGCYRERSRALAFRVEPLEEVIDLMKDELKSRHIERLKSGECTIELGTQFLELLINMERIADHCSNVAVYILRETDPKGETEVSDSHEYLKLLHAGSDGNYNAMYEEYKSRYFAPLGKK